MSVSKQLVGDQPFPGRRPGGFSAIGGFFFFGAAMATYAALTLLWPGTTLDRLWKLNPNAHLQLAAIGRAAGIPFIALALALLFAGIGWFKRCYWGWLLGVVIIATNLTGDFVNILLGEWLKGLLGVSIAGLLLFYLTRPRVRLYFLRS